MFLNENKIKTRTGELENALECPKCGMVSAAYVALGPENKCLEPKPGMISCCTDCGIVLEFNETATALVECENWESKIDPRVKVLVDHTRNLIKASMIAKKRTEEAMRVKERLKQNYRWN